MKKIILGLILFLFLGINQSFSYTIANISNTVLTSKTMDTGPRLLNIVFSKDGRKGFTHTVGSVNSYNISNPNDISTMGSRISSFTTGDCYASGGSSDDYSIDISSDGTKIYLGAERFNVICEYTLSVPYDITTKTFTRKKTTPIYFFQFSISDDGTKIVASSYGGGSQFYTLSTPYNVSTLSAGTGLSVPLIGKSIKLKGSMLFFIGYASNVLYQYNISNTGSLTLLTTKTLGDTTGPGISFTYDYSKIIYKGGQGSLTYNAYLVNDSIPIEVCHYENVPYPNYNYFNYDSTTGTGYLEKTVNTSSVPPLDDYYKHYVTSSGAIIDISLHNTYSVQNFNSGSLSFFGNYTSFDSSVFDDNPIIKIKSSVYMDHIYLSGNFVDGYYKVYDCTTGTTIYEKVLSSETKHLTKTKQICLMFNKSVFNYNYVQNIRFGDRYLATYPKQLCQSVATGLWTLEGQSFTGSLLDPASSSGFVDNVSPVDIPNLNCSTLDVFCNLKKFLTPDFSLDNTKTQSSFSVFTDKLNTLLGLNTFTSYFNITLPSTANLDISLPVPYLTNNFSINIKYVTATLPPITDTLNKNAITDNIQSKYFISFLFVILYIGVRFLILFGIFYIFQMFYKYINKFVKHFFGNTFDNSGGGNLFSLGFYIFFLVFIFGIFTFILSYILQFDTITSTIITFINAFISILVISFGNYSFFSGLVNFFFVSILSSFLLYIIYLFTNKFLRIN